MLRHVKRVAQSFILLLVGVAIGWSWDRAHRHNGGAAPETLGRAVPRLAFKDQRLDTVIHQFERSLGVPISVNWAELESVGITGDAPVNFHCDNTTVLDALTQLINHFPQDSVRFAVTAERDRILIDTADHCAGHVVVRPYDVRDFLRSDILDEFTMPVVFDAPVQPPAANLADERRQRLLTLITDSVDPDSWHENGGTVGGIRLLGERVYVLQTWENQISVGRLLEDLRKGPERSDWPGPPPDVRTVDTLENGKLWRLQYDLRCLLPADANEAALQKLTDRLMEEVEPNSWRENGGSLGVIREVYKGRILIIQTPENHQRVRAWLDARVARQPGAPRKEAP